VAETQPKISAVQEHQNLISHNPAGPVRGKKEGRSMVEGKKRELIRNASTKVDWKTIVANKTDGYNALHKSGTSGEVPPVGGLSWEKIKTMKCRSWGLT